MRAFELGFPFGLVLDRSENVCYRPRIPQERDAQAHSACLSLGTGPFTSTNPHQETMSQDLTHPELPAIGFVAEISDEDRQILSGYGEFLPVHPDKDLIVEGQEQDSLYLVLSGRLHATTQQDGRLTLLGRLGPGDLVGEVNVFDPQTASATVTAKEFAQVWRIDRPMVDDFIRENPGAAAQLLVHISTQLSKRLRETNEKVSFVRKTLGGNLFS